MNFLNLQDSIYSISKIVSIHREDNLIRVNTGDRITTHYYGSKDEAKKVFEYLIRLLDN